jgi:hypothetical protein
VYRLGRLPARRANAQLLQASPAGTQFILLSFPQIRVDFDGAAAAPSSSPYVNMFLAMNTRRLTGTRRPVGAN